MLSNDKTFYRSAYETFPEDAMVILVDREAPNWVVADTRVQAILAAFDGQRTFAQVVADYATQTRFELSRAWQDVATAVSDGGRYKLLHSRPPEQAPYAGRAAHLAHEPLREVWLHTTNACNLACTHCLVSSGPDGAPGLPITDWLRVVDEARSLGARRFYLTGGEPFVRRDVLTLIDAILEDPQAELAILTNGILLRGERLQALARRDTERLRLQISLDGSTPTINDPIRGQGSFAKIVEGIRHVAAAGFHVTVTTAVTRDNADDVPSVTRLISELGVKRQHLLWLHRRGRAGLGSLDLTPSNEALAEVVSRVREVCASTGVVLDNHEAIKMRLQAPPGTKNDLSAAGVHSLCVYCDGTVYPSASMANVASLRCGDVCTTSLESIWRESPVWRQFREASVEAKAQCRPCRYKFLCGGGDIEHAYFYGGSLLAHDPYCTLHLAMFDEALVELGSQRRALLANGQAGFHAPVIYTGMGDGGGSCVRDGEHSDAGSPAVRTIPSECVLSFDLDGPRELVREFYADAAQRPSEELCCPVRPHPSELAHIPPEVVERFYGCGSPVQDAAVLPGETMLDLGCGAGIDVFIAAKKTGPSGRAIGVDMTTQMLEVANASRAQVAKALGFDVVEFRHGFLEHIPAEASSVDVVTSNCVLNLSPDKLAVLAEIWRVLKDHGRMCVSDIVSDEEVPPHQRRNPRLWGECLSGALTEEELIAYMERAGFYGIEILKRAFWKEVERHRFYSITVRGYKYAKGHGCIYQGHKAVYLGPFQGVSDEEGHWFPRNIAVEICTDTVAKLSNPPYQGRFRIVDISGAAVEVRCCRPESEGSRATSCC